MELKPCPLANGPGHHIIHGQLKTTPNLNMSTSQFQPFSKPFKIITWKVFLSPTQYVCDLCHFVDNMILVMSLYLLAVQDDETLEDVVMRDNVYNGIRLRTKPFIFDFDVSQGKRRNK